MDPQANQSSPPAGRNRLRFEKSPYLLQHKDNPVDWYPWGEEAFAAASRLDKPIFLSIGYSTCHWCHVMEHESFEDEQVAALMNDAFVNIKVDREERPDLDAVYMTVCQMLTRGGGWPLTIIMDADRRPFFAGTYIPRQTRFGRPGMLEIIPKIQQAWRSRRDELNASAQQILAALQDAERSAPAGEALDRGVLDSAYRQFAEQFDAVYGGFSTAPKFPTPHNLLFLLRHWKRTGNSHALAMVEKTLQAMRRGGVYDQLGYGIHRYSVDQEWRVPHFEKMLYDQAQVAAACVQTWQATHKPIYAATAREIFTYVLRDMTDPAGGFHCAEDADSEGVEGKFYVWAEPEIRQVLDPAEADLFIDVYNIQMMGNYRDEATGQASGTNIPHLSDPMQPHDALVVEFQDEQRLATLERARQKLLETREKRVRPGKDDKVLADWNGLMIAALAQGAAALDDRRYAGAAGRAADFVLGHMRTDTGRLLHRWRDGQAGITANLDDYAFFVYGLIELYEATFDAARLQQALDLTDRMIEHFLDESAGGFFFTPDDGEPVLVRQKPIYDGAVPSGNAVAVYNLLRLAKMTGRTRYEQVAERAVRALSEQVRQVPMAYTKMLVALDFAFGPSREIVIAGPADAPATRQMLAALAEPFLPNTVVLLRPTDEPSPAITQLAPFTASQTAADNQAAAYVCEDFQCRQPTTDVREMLEMVGVEPVG